MPAVRPRPPRFDEDLPLRPPPIVYDGTEPGLGRLGAEFVARVERGLGEGLARARPEERASVGDLLERALAAAGGPEEVEREATRLLPVLLARPAAHRPHSVPALVRILTGLPAPTDPPRIVGDLGVEAFRWWHRLTEAEAQRYLAERQAIDPELGPDAPFGAPGTTHVAEVEALNERWRLRAAGGAA